MKHAKVIEVRLCKPGDAHYIPDCETTKWVAIDSAGRTFYGATEGLAREWAENYNHPPRKSRAHQSEVENHA